MSASDVEYAPLLRDERRDLGEWAAPPSRVYVEAVAPWQPAVRVAKLVVQEARPLYEPSTKPCSSTTERVDGDMSASSSAPHSNPHAERPRSGSSASPGCVTISTEPASNHAALEMIAC